MGGQQHHRGQHSVVDLSEKMLCYVIDKEVFAISVGEGGGVELPRGGGPLGGGPLGGGALIVQGWLAFSIE